MIDTCLIRQLVSCRMPNHAVRAAALAVLVASLPAAAVTAELHELDPALFPVPTELTANVAFWTQVYTVYDNDVVLLHDELYLHVVYAAIDFSELNARETSESRNRQVRRDEIRKTQQKYRTLLHNLAAGKVSKSHPNDQARVEEMFRAVPGDRRKYTTAISRMRTQTCLKNRFAEAIERSGFYMPAIEEIFRRQGLPVELTRMPFVESLFQWNARSSAYAGGIWQFMPSTARLYMKMELEYDERFDPLKASEAAARLLAESYDALTTWPLAITSYNHGLYGIKRAVRRVGSHDLGEIVKRYRSRSFGFASRNFYAEFIAAAQVYENRRHHFPDSEPLPTLRFEHFVPDRYVSLKDLAQGTPTDLKTLREMNPALKSEVWAGHLYLPRRYPLLVPAGQLGDFQAAYEVLPDTKKSSHQVGTHYRVRRGDSLSTIAAKLGTSVHAIQRANALQNPNRIRVGQRLLIPPGRGGVVPVAAVSASPGFHVVRRGETLSQIASRYGTTVAVLLSANKLASANRIYAGQKLTVPGGNGEATHVVRSGETLAVIAKRYGTTVRAIQRANQIRSHIIHPRQVLIIPSS